MSISFDRDRFVIQTPNTSYVILLKKGQFQGTEEVLTTVCNGYWGKKLLRPQDVPTNYTCMQAANAYSLLEWQRQEYPAFGANYYNNECLRVKFADGVRDLRLSYAAHTISADRNTLTITMRDIYYPFEVDLVYKIYDGLDLIDRYTVLRNMGNTPVTLETLYSANWTVPYNERLRLTSMGSSANREYEIQQQSINQSTVLLESRSGISNSTMFPYFAIDDYTATEQSGEVWFGTLQWSGNWQIKAGWNHVRWPQICGGISNFNTSVQLNSGESFETPIFTGGFVTSGFGAASRQLHHYQRITTKTPWTEKVMPVMYNAWASFFFNLDEQMLMQQAERCRDIGIELFMIDDGWFENRNNDKTGLGDWKVDAKKFPNGLQPLINRVEELGMIFGIWVEPEMVSEESEIYKQHPEWILRYPTRQPVKKRHQYVLNFGLEEVYQHTIQWLDKLLRENHIQYLKWDMNRYLTEANWNSVTGQPDEEVYIKYVRNFYRVFEYLNQNFPHVMLENCASGGQRADLSMAKWCGRINRSDNQDCLDILRMHEGFTRVNLSKSAGGGCHLHHQYYITASGRRETYKRMALTGMLGSLSVGLDLRKITPEEKQEVAGYIDFYKQIRETVQLGDMYILRSAYDENTPAVIYQFVSRDQKESVVFVYHNNKGFWAWLEAIRLQGLKEDLVYEIDISYAKDLTSHAPMAGDSLMNMGLDFADKRILREDSVYGCFVVRLKAQ